MKPALALLIPTLLLGACTREPTYGDKLISQANRTRALGAEWKRGDAMISEGERMKTKGAKLIEDGDGLIKRGKALKAKVEATTS